MYFKSVTVERTATLVLQLSNEDVCNLKNEMDSLSDMYEGKLHAACPSLYTLVETLISKSEETGLI